MSFFGKDKFVKEFITHLDAMYNFARWLTKDSDEAEEIVHDALLKILLNGNFKIPKSEIRTYSFAVIRRGFIDRVRKGKYEVTSNRYPENEFNITSEDDSNFLFNLEKENIQKDIERALESIPVDLRSLVVLANFEGFSGDEIAKIEDIPPGTVKSRLRKAYQLLRRKLMDYSEEVKK